MSELSQSNPPGRFTGLAQVYARCRPGYPEAAVDYIMTRCGLGPQALLVDVGCGTGIASRLFASRGVPVVGVEPNADMRARAQAEPLPAGCPVPRYCEGRAEATGLAAGMADAVLAAQAFHWFQADAALREFRRLLKPAGWVALVWNERDEADPFTAAYGAVIRTAPDTAAVEGPRARAGEPLSVSPLFEQGERVRFTNQQELDEEGVLGRAFSASYAPREPAAVEAFAAALRDVFARYQRDGKVMLCYETTVHCARARASDCGRQ
jgi:SAM-dependent methyltransferase